MSLQSGFGGPVVSTLMNNSDTNLADDEKTAFDWVKDGNLSKLRDTKPQSLDAKDDQVSDTSPRPFTSR